MTKIGRFELDLEMRTLSCEGERIHIGARAFDILSLLASRRGHVVTKDELIRFVWPNTIVEENNLQVHLSALRKALGVDRVLITTLPGRGYQLAGNSINTAASAAPDADDVRAMLQRQYIVDGLTPCAGQVFGRESEIRVIADLLKQARAVTLVGAGGIGKTCLATAVARHVMAHFADGVYFVGLAAYREKSAVLIAVANACGLALTDCTVTSARIAGALAGRHCLIILDNAEHVIDVVADLTDTLTLHGSSVHIITTSREPIRVASESVFRVQPLDVPTIGADYEELLGRSAVRLFLHRARALQPSFAEDSASVSLVGEVCRRLDGIPLAIELAAARAATCGIDGLHRRLDDRLKILTGGSRTALPRHQTLRATFDWSYALLDLFAQAVFRRLSRFADRFSLEDACSVAADNRIDPTQVMMKVSELVEKSLLTVEFEGTSTQYRLGESTRAYAREKLHDEGEDQKVSAAHARQLKQRFETAWQFPSKHDALEDARSALDWAFSPTGDATLGIGLTGAIAEPMLACLLREECCNRVSVAIAALEELPKGSVEVECELRLRTALALALPSTRGTMSDAPRLWFEVLSRAAEEQNVAFQVRALWGLFDVALAGGRIHTSLKYAMMLQTIADMRGDDTQRMLADVLVGTALSWLGEHTSARPLLEAGLRRLAPHGNAATLVESFGANAIALANASLARVLWSQGRPAEAMALIDSTVESDLCPGQEPSVSQVLGDSAIPLALLCGEMSVAARYLGMLRTQANIQQLEIWQECCDSLAGYLDILSGHPERGLGILEVNFADLQTKGFRRMQTSMIGVWAEAEARAGRSIEARRALIETMSHCNENGNRLFVPDMWRTLGTISVLDSQVAAAHGASPAEHEAEAQASFMRAIDLAQQQGARMWELRAATALAQLWHTQGRIDEATHLLAPLCAHFSNSTASVDVRLAYESLDKLTRANDSHAEVADVAAHSGHPTCPQHALWSESGIG